MRVRRERSRCARNRAMHLVGKWPWHMRGDLACAGAGKPSALKWRRAWRREEKDNNILALKAQNIGPDGKSRQKWHAIAAASRSNGVGVLWHAIA